MSLSNDTVLGTLKNQFVCGYRDITGQPYAGRSGRHDTDGQAIVTTNGAGPHNVQMFFLSEDGVVLHCLLGYWAPQDLLQEIKFAKDMSRLWHNSSLSPEAKDKAFADANLQAIRKLPKDMIQRSHLQSFDAKHELQDPATDFRFQKGDFRPDVQMGRHNDLKSTIQVIHERMAKRPFMVYEAFDVATFSDYGKQKYDKKEDLRSVATGKRK